LEKLFYFLLILIAFTCEAQDSMQEGFDLLESGNFSEAEKYFGGYLDIHDKTARICHARSIGLGGRKEEALDLFLDLVTDYPEDQEVLLNLAEAYLWNNLPKTAAKKYGALLEIYPENFVANYGFANANAALFNNDVAIKYISKAIALQPNNESAENAYLHIMIAKAYELYKSGQYHKSKLWISKVYQLEPNNEKAKGIEELIEQDSKCHLMAEYNHGKDRGGNSVIENGTARQQYLNLSDEFIMSSKTRLHLGMGLSSTLLGEKTIDRTLVKGGLEIFWSDRLYSKVSYFSEMHNYTVDLLKRNILMQHYAVSNNLLLTENLGLYINGVYTTQSDNNSRNLVYGSLYYSLVSKPIVRVGVNYNYFGYQEMKVNYFSPNQFQLGEFFMMIDNMQSESALMYKLQVSFGAQQFSGSEIQSVNRVECAVGYKHKSGFQFLAKYLTNSAASATALGVYAFDEWSLGLSCSF